MPDIGSVGQVQVTRCQQLSTGCPVSLNTKQSECRWHALNKAISLRQRRRLTDGPDERQELSTESEPHPQGCSRGTKNEGNKGLFRAGQRLNVCRVCRRIQPIDPPWTLPFPSPLPLSAKLPIMATLSAPTDPAIKSTRQRGHSAMVCSPFLEPLILALTVTRVIQDFKSATVHIHYLIVT